MSIHPSQIPVSSVFDVKNYSQVSKIMNEILSLNIDKESAFKVLLPKESTLAKKIGYTLVNELNRALRIQGYRENLRYFVYHHDPQHYAILFVSQEKLSKLNP